LRGRETAEGVPAKLELLDIFPARVFIVGGGHDFRREVEVHLAGSLSLHAFQQFRVFPDVDIEFTGFLESASCHGGRIAAPVNILFLCFVSPVHKGRGTCRRAVRSSRSMNRRGTYRPQGFIEEA
jgi:hypothetical protein